ncbi:hypothetical protein Ahy_B07g088223 [Arachis hypogaea]|uniref:SWIM-type domain-containing protein n=1 Tax=Arachis hypogaea TaxID=3818 RepID=A0A444YDY6_ARAHY|nr:hypothetical protein Ahy_B07g088223 [Arachis hypogaea]
MVRIREPDENKSQSKYRRTGTFVTCRNCGQYGHNMRHCPNPIVSAPEPATAESNVATDSIEPGSGAHAAGAAARGRGRGRDTGLGRGRGQRKKNYSSAPATAAESGATNGLPTAESGRFRLEGCAVRYLDGETSIVDYCNDDEWSLIEVYEIVSRQEYLKKDIAAMWYKAVNAGLEEGLTMLKNDKDAMDMARIGVKDDMVEVYVVHKTSEVREDVQPGQITAPAERSDEAGPGPIVVYEGPGVGLGSMPATDGPTEKDEVEPTDAVEEEDKGSETSDDNDYEPRGSESSRSSESIARNASDQSLDFGDSDDDREGAEGLVDVNITEDRGYSGGKKKFVVDLRNQECSCRKFQLSGIPCAHAMTCIRKMCFNVDTYVSDYYKKAAYISCYQHVVLPVNGPNLWDRTQLEDVLPPTYRKPIERPKKKRTRAADEQSNRTGLSREGQQQKCSYCLCSGHNKRSCPKKRKVTPSPVVDNAGNSASKGRSQRGVRKSVRLSAKTPSSKVTESGNRKQKENNNKSPSHPKRKSGVSS